MTINRREFIEGAALVAGSVAVAGVPALPADSAELSAARMHVTAVVNGQPRTIAVEPRTTLLDALREQLHLTGTKKACDRGECGACTVLVNGRRVLSCMSLAVMQEGKRITTIEGLEREGKLHPLQAAFVEYDGFQCGFCTSGQIMSGRCHDRGGARWLAECRYRRCDEAVHARRSTRRGRSGSA